MSRNLLMTKLLFASLLSVLPCVVLAQSATIPTAVAETKVDVTFSGGHDTVGEDAKLTATLSFGTDFAKNGSIKEIKIGS